MSYVADISLQELVSTVEGVIDMLLFSVLDMAWGLKLLTRLKLRWLFFMPGRCTPYVCLKTPSRLFVACDIRVKMC